MKTSILIEDGDVRIHLTPETELEKVAVRELGDDVVVGRSFEKLVLRARRDTNVRTLSERMKP